MYALIMAGGLGTRFWPRSRRKHPKQLLNIVGERSLIQNTVLRLRPFVPNENIFVVSTAEQLHAIREQLAEIPSRNLITEPRGKNTAPCIGLGALVLERLDPEAVMVVLPADHLISDDQAFARIVRAGARVAKERNGLVTVGIKPTYPATGYGYVQFEDGDDTIDGESVKRVKTFAEKPNIETAERFVRSGDFLWNSGIFIWKAKRILQEIEEHLPQLYDGLCEIRTAMGEHDEEEITNKIYCQIKSVSIDYGVMEYAKDVWVLPADFGWNDLGSWDEVYKLYDLDELGNGLNGQHLVYDSSGCFVDSPDKSVALVGVKDLIVINTGDALLICHKDRAQDVKQVIDIAKRKNLEHLL